ncbi:MAG: hypothetical protein B6244_14045 [Candidatus Cloacimonetes bacterium 4572_55]|nr:MAG: hypothetical protein B6244_14045 [Candidatus Cloacimonetes bacterium 4572_55]
MIRAYGRSATVIPTVSEWGMIVLSLLVLITGTFILRRSKQAVIAV